MLKIDLNKGWKLTNEKLSWGSEMAPAVLVKEDGWLKCDLPCDIHVPLLENGIIKEPVEALNSYECTWTEEKSWWFKKDFSVDDSAFEQDIIQLTLESLDVEADIFLNGFHLTHHRSAFYPYIANVKNKIKRGDNVLLVRLTSGLEHVSEQDIAEIKNSVGTESSCNRGDKRRANVRKPQYVFGWDWGPRIATCGIMKDVYIEAYKKVAIRGVHISTQTVSSDKAELDVKVEIENLHVFKSFDGRVKVDLLFTDLQSNEISTVTVDKLEHLRSGLNFINLKVSVDNPKLWWPNGMGCQNLYTVKTSLTTDSAETFYPDFKYGIRTLSLNMDKLNDKERLFAFEVNGVKTFSKGGNWIPSDSIYGRVSDEKYETLIKEARDANFNMLRIWGGGIYEKDIFYEKCDEYGILIWHDFMFACAMYPDNEDWFKTEVEHEMNYQTRRLRNHSCIALWCGNNENHWGFNDWWVGDKPSEFYGGAICYNIMAPAIIENNCPNIPYWNSSPYGGDEPNSNEVGDRHHWGDCTMNEEMSKRITPEEYDKITARFISEYGYIGPCAKSTIERYHDGNPIDRDSAIWKSHNNTFEKDTVVAGITKHYGNSENMDLDCYLLYAGLCQGLMYQYSLEAIRYKRNCWGSLFWMYNDCWGEVGWTVIDYYLKRKPSYYYVKRAFEPVKLILREEFGIVKVLGINESDKPVVFEMEYGYVSFDGKNRRTHTTKIELPPFTRELVYEFDKGNYDFTRGVCFVKPENSIHPAILRTNVFRDLDLMKSEIEISEIKTIEGKNECGKLGFMVYSETYAHAVRFCLCDDIHPSDEYFDLLPGEHRYIELQNVPEDFKVKDIKPLSIC